VELWNIKRNLISSKVRVGKDISTGTGIINNDLALYLKDANKG
jgi:hypothetical protein